MSASREALARLLTGTEPTWACRSWLGLISVSVIYYGQGDGRGAEGVAERGGELARAHGWDEEAARPLPPPATPGWRRALKALREPSFAAMRRGLDAAVRAEPRDAGLRVLRGVTGLVKRNGLGFELEPAALSDLELARSLDSDGVWPAMALGIARYMRRDFAGARELFLDAAEADPRNPWCSLLAADSAYFNSQFDEAGAEFERETVRRPNDAWAHALRGRALYLRADPGTLAALERAAALAPRAGWIVTWRAAARALAGDKAGALRDYDEAVVLQPGYERAHSWRGALLAGMGRLPAAERSLRRAERLAPSSEVTLYALARVRLRRGDAGGARRAMSRAISVNRETSWERGWTDLHHADRAVGSSAVELETMLRRLPRWSDGWAWLGQTFLLLKRYAKAAEALDRALSLSPRSAWAWTWRGELDRRLGAWRAAEPRFSRALALDARRAWAWAGRGSCRLMLGRPREALADLERALALQPRCGGGLALAWRGEALLRLGRRAEGEASLRQALELHPHWHWARRALGEAPPPEGARGADETLSPEHDAPGWVGRGTEALRAGNADESLACASRALEDSLDPGFGSALRLRSAAYAAKGDLVAALDQLARLVELGSADAEDRRRAGRFALELALSANARNLAASIWRGLLVHGVMQDRQGGTRRLEQAAAAGDAFTRRHGWRDATGAAGPERVEAVISRISPGWALAAEALRARGLGAARRKLERAAALEPDDAALRVLAALTHFEIRSPFVAASARAWEHLRAAGAADPGQPWAHALAGLAHFFAQDMSDAIASFTRLVELRPGWAWSWLLRGIPEWYFARLKDSVDDLGRAAALDPGLAWAHLLLGRSSEDLKDASNVGSALTGLRALDAAAALERSGVVLGWRGCAHMGRGDAVRAKADFDAAIKAWPGYDRARAWRGMLSLQTGRPKRALADLKRAAAMNPAYPTAQYALAKACLQTGRPRLALEALERGARRDRQYLWEWCWFDVEHPNPACRKAIDDLDILLKRFPRAAWGRAWRGQSKLLLKDYRGAAEDLRAAAKLAPRDPWARLWLGETHRRLGLCRQALVEIERCLALAPELAWAHVSRGGALVHLGDYPAAIASLDRALSLSPRAGRGLAHAWRGEARWRMGDRPGAGTDFRRALEFYPNWWWLRRWLDSLEHGGAAQPQGLGSSPAPLDADLDAWLKAHPHESGALLSRGERRGREGDLAGAVADASCALEMNMNPVDPRALGLRARLLASLGDAEAAGDDLRRMKALTGGLS